MSVLQRCVTQSSEPLRISLWNRSSERIDEIAAVEGVDLLAVGPSDLSRSLGVSGQPDHPRLVAAIGQPRCMQRLENTTNMASSACQSVFFLPV